MHRIGVRIFLVLLVSACGQNFNSDTGDAAFAGGGNPLPNYSYLAGHLFSQCTGCHGDQIQDAGYNLASYAGVYAALIPGSPNGSAVYQAVTTNMPYGQPNLESTNPALVTALQTWIQQGALNN